MDFNKHTLAAIVEEMALLMEILGMNEFKIRALQAGARALEKTETDIHAALNDGTLGTLPGIGKGMAAIIREYAEHGSIAEHTELRAAVPDGVLQLTELRGVGGKKARALYEHLGIASIGELEYACKENRLLELKGFGTKTQDAILAAIAVWNAAQGKFHLHKATAIANDVCTILREQCSASRAEIAGSLLRSTPVIERIDIVADCTGTSIQECWSDATGSGNIWLIIHLGATVFIHCTTLQEFERTFFLQSCDDELRTAIQQRVGELPPDATEESIHSALGIRSAIPYQLREGAEILDKVVSSPLPDLIDGRMLRGMLHIHTTWSDGIHSVRAMALAAKELGFEYIAFCDHSRTAVYANGMSIERVLAQHDEIDTLNSEGLGIRILKGIESDILSDGSLDYPDDILSLFDMVVASVHSAFKLPYEQQTERIITAVRNPYTTILGHPTGRLLLAREGYACDVERIIDAAAESGTAIELNANPYRLDLDQSYHAYASSRRVPVAINPDSHETATLSEVYFGVGVG
ncbi:MAG: PHP domain-containing protein, partial [Candidatus Kapabacteria bacterium]|nr:PHP domain-containing protein [Candidatus Kapabacteria bacterium]